MSLLPQPDDLIFWIDLETTGLEPDDEIMEIGTVYTDGRLEPFGELRLYTDVSRTVLDRMDQFVVDMHTTSGLLAEWTAGPRVPIATADGIIAAQLAAWERELSPPAVWLAGAGVSHFDLPRIKVSMPETWARCYHAPLDVSQLRRLVGFIPELQVAYQAMIDADQSNPAPHRALADARTALSQLVAFRDTLAGATFMYDELAPPPTDEQRERLMRSFPYPHPR